MDERVFFDQVKVQIHDAVTTVDGVLYGRFSKLSEAEYKVKYPDMVVMDAVEAMALYEAKFLTPVSEITEEQFQDNLDVLPPSRWLSFAGGEHFHICERIVSNIVLWNVRIGRSYYQFQDRTTLTTHEIAQRCQDFRLRQEQAAEETRETVAA